MRKCTNARLHAMRECVSLNSKTGSSGVPDRWSCSPEKLDPEPCGAHRFVADHSSRFIVGADPGHDLATVGRIGSEELEPVFARIPVNEDHDVGWVAIERLR